MNRAVCAIIGPGDERTVQTRRLGWTFRDRDANVTPYSEPPPDPELLHKQMTERAAFAQSACARAASG